MPLEKKYTLLLTGLLPGVVGEENAEAFSLLYDRLLLTNEKMNVTAVTAPLSVTLRHFADSLSLFRVPAFREALEGSPTLCDVGCGGGFPGLPVALVRRDLPILMVDSTEKKIRALGENADALDLPNVKPLCGRAEVLAGVNGNFRGKADLVFSRAVARLNVLCELCLPFLRPGGVFFALKGQKAAEEWAECRHAVRELGGETVSLEKVSFETPDLAAFSAEEREEIGEFLSREHAIAVIRKIRPTPPAYPRKWAQILKNPL